MSYSLSFLPEVEEDAVSGYVWYEKKATGLGEEFLRVFYACAGEIIRRRRADCKTPFSVDIPPPCPVLPQCG
jgi:hypothetical protein